MNSISVSVFLNNTIVDRASTGISATSVAFGDWCLTPVRCLFDGNKVTFSYPHERLVVDHEKEYATSIESKDKPKRNFFRVLAAIVLLVPGVIIGSAFKGLGYLSESIRLNHDIAVTHCTPRDYTLGSSDERLGLAQIREQLAKFEEKNTFNPPLKDLVIYAKPGTAINEDPGFLKWNPEKIILVGARIVHAPSSAGIARLDDDIFARRSEWECRSIRTAPTGTNQDDVTHIYQRSRRSVADALKDVPPKISQFSFKRYHRVYNIV